MRVAFVQAKMFTACSK